jgi:hypothetical protein
MPDIQTLKSKNVSESYPLHNHIAIIKHIQRDCDDVVIRTLLENINTDMTFSRILEQVSRTLNDNTQSTFLSNNNIIQLRCAYQ